MNIIFFTVFGVLLMQSISSASSCSCKQATPLKLIFQVVQHFKEIQCCYHTFTTSYSVSNEGVRHISYQSEFNENESPIDLCSCVHSYLSQKDWLDGSTQSCCITKNIATMTISGKADPTYNQETDNSDSESPIEYLKEIFDQFPKAEYENHHCRPSTSMDEAGNIHFKVQCDLHPDSPCKEEICEGISQYLNQDKWLGELTYECTSDGNVLDMEIMGK